MEKTTNHPTDIFYKLAKEITSAYVFMILVVFPFYFQNKYYNIGNAKWKFFSMLTLISGSVLIALVILNSLFLWHKHELRGYVQNIRLSALDKFMLAYLAVVSFSTLLSPYKNQVIWGTDGWHMGFIAQICFVLIYYFVSRYWKWDTPAVILYLAAAFLVFLLAVLMRFRIDPLGLYNGLEEEYIINFLSTIGQATWYSSYMVLLFPLGMFAFWSCNNKLYRILAGAFTSIGFMSAITQNSDSAYIAFMIQVFVLFWLSFRSNRKFKRFLQVMAICFTSFKLIGICQLLFPERAVPLDGISTFCSQSNLIWIFLAVTVLFYFGLLLLEKHKNFDIPKLKALPVALLIVLLTAVLLAVIYICLNTMGKLPENMRSDSNYLLFNEYWGNNRGLSWTVAIKSFLEGSLPRKIIGCGPDGFSLYTRNFFGKELAEKWGQSVALTCAHNEWLNSLVNLGLIGAAAYIGIFVSAVSRFLKNSNLHPALPAIAVSILCYMGHNFFCYQQVVCTPTIFLLMGAGEAIIRHKREC